MLDAIVGIGDWLFGWMLAMPVTVVVILLGVISSTLIVLARRWTTDQEHLARCDHDKKRLGELARQARARRDKAAAKRHKTTQALVSLKMLKAEGLPLLVGLLPIALMGTWGYYRLAFIPPRDGEVIPVELSLPTPAIGQVVTLIPAEGVEADSWIQRVRPGEGEPAHGIARWQVKAKASEQPYVLTFRYRDRSYDHPLQVGRTQYAEPVRQHDPNPQILLPQSVAHLRQPRILGLIPWFDAQTTVVGSIFPAWLITYIVVVIPFVLLLKKVLRIY